MYTPVVPPPKDAPPSVFRPSFLNNVYNLLEEQFLVLGIPAERQDLVTSVRVYRFDDSYAGRIPRDFYSPYLEACQQKFRFYPTDPSVGVNIVREWSLLE